MGGSWGRSTVSTLSRGPPLDPAGIPCSRISWPRSCKPAAYHRFYLCSSWRLGSLDPHRVELLKIFACRLRRVSVSRLSLLWWTTFQVLLEVFNFLFSSFFFLWHGVCVCVLCTCDVGVCMYVFMCMSMEARGQYRMFSYLLISIFIW